MTDALLALIISAIVCILLIYFWIDKHFPDKKD